MHIRNTGYPNLYTVVIMFDNVLNGELLWSKTVSPGLNVEKSSAHSRCNFFHWIIIKLGQNVCHDFYCGSSGVKKNYVTRTKNRLTL